jgi:hypothetical protein
MDAELAGSDIRRSIMAHEVVVIPRDGVAIRTLTD